MDDESPVFVSHIYYNIGIISPLGNRGKHQHGRILLLETKLTCSFLFLPRHFFILNRTNREAALSPAGAEQVQAACAELERFPELSPTVIKYSLAASALDSAQIVGNELNLGRDRIVPEFTYLDPRGIGQWDMYRYSTTQPAVWALDATEAGPLGTGGRPPANQDGTPVSVILSQK